MAFSPPSRESMRQLLETMAIGTAGGVALHLLGIPAAYIIGSTIATAGAALAGRRLGTPPLFVRIALIAIGIVLGSGITPETVRGVVDYPLTIMILIVTTVSVIAGSGLYLHYVHRWNPLLSFMGGTPGALSQIMAFSAEKGLDMRAIAIVHMVRVLALTAGMPLALWAFGLAAGFSPPVAPRGVTGFELVLLLTCSIIPALLLVAIRFSGGWLFGAMLGSGALHGSGIVEGHLPDWVMAAAIISIGSITGSRFSGTTPRMLLRHLGAGFGAIAVGLGTASIFMGLAMMILPNKATEIIVGFVPGAQDTMMVLALSLGLDPVFIGVHHAVRFFFVSLLIPFGAAAVERWMKR